MDGWPNRLSLKVSRWIPPIWDKEKQWFQLSSVWVRTLADALWEPGNHSVLGQQVWTASQSLHWYTGQVPYNMRSRIKNWNKKEKKRVRERAGASCYLRTVGIALWCVGGCLGKDLARKNSADWRSLVPEGFYRPSIKVSKARRQNLKYRKQLPNYWVYSHLSFFTSL